MERVSVQNESGIVLNDVSVNSGATEKIIRGEQAVFGLVYTADPVTLSLNGFKYSFNIKKEDEVTMIVVYASNKFRTNSKDVYRYRAGGYIRPDLDNDIELCTIHFIAVPVSKIKVIAPTTKMDQYMDAMADIDWIYSIRLVMYFYVTIACIIFLIMAPNIHRFFSRAVQDLI